MTTHAAPAAPQHGATLHAWVDESMHAERPGASAAMYLLAAAIADPAACHPMREALRAVTPGKRDRFHWHAEEPQDQRKMIATVAQLDLMCTVVVATPLNPQKQERARRKCMERLFFELHQLGVSTAFLENRTPSLNKRDRQMVDAMRSTGALPKTLRIERAFPSVEPMLWVPDAVAGALGMARKGEDRSHIIALGTQLEQVLIDL